MGLFKKSMKVSDVRIWRCPRCQAVLEKGALGKTIFVGESTEKIIGSGTCANCGETFAQSDIYGGKYDCRETSRGVEKARPPAKLSLIVFRPGQAQPPDPQKYYQDILKKAFGDSGIKVEAWRIAGTRSLINVNEARSLYSMGKARGIFPDFGEPDQDWSGRGFDGEEVTVLFFP